MGDGARGSFLKIHELYLEEWRVWDKQRRGRCKQEEQHVARSGGRAGSLGGVAGIQTSRAWAAAGWGGGICCEFGEPWATVEASTQVSVRL